MVSKMKALEKKTKKLVKAILESNENANDIVDILELSDSEHEEEILLFIRSVSKIFEVFLPRMEWFKIKRNIQQQGASDDTQDPSANPKDVFSEWLYDKYLISLRKLLSFMHHSSSSIREFSFCTLMKFVSCESKARGKFSSGISGLSNILFHRIIENLIDGKFDCRDLINRFGEFLEFDDVRFYTLKNISTIVETKLEGDEKDRGIFLCGNVYTLLDSIVMPESEEELQNLMVAPIDGPKAKSSSKSSEGKSNEDDIQLPSLLLNSHKRVFSRAWLNFLQLDISSDIHKKVLIHLHTKVMPFMLNPKLLIDFLTDSYNLKGASSLLALNGLFILIHKHNLDYPDFYKKLYALLEPGIFHAKYSARFFHLADLFLSSTYLPAYLVAAFCKRLARLSLSAPPHGAMLVIPFVCNLIRRHPNCKLLIHQVQPLDLLGEKNLDQVNVEEKTRKMILGDPYIGDEPDPAKSCAMDSSLWEIKTLQEHYYPGVSSSVCLFEQPLTKVETDISEYLEVTYDELFDRECTRFTLDNCALEFQSPKDLLGKELSDFWCLA